MKIPPILFRWLASAWTIIMLIGCLTPNDKLPDSLTSFNDKFLHAGIFAPFVVLWILAGFRISYVFVVAILFGGLIELLQYTLPINRSGDWIDLAADSLGAFLGVILGWVVQKTYKPFNS
ncbi:VanZ family protein [Spirosoma sp. HMF3257]|uniref:VanZ family protein n=1 Tax=Spirosoma telluris TaxID=2183553 RepID=A0A327NKN6_9BACT|nr:VanZ family protein [Spirosoma telluris]RAI75757.1 VanZ family protein [Spirosoma telluris]